MAETEEADVEVEEDYEGSEEDVEPEQEEEDPVEEEYPMKVVYCKVCSLPPEYCTYLNKKVKIKCAEWIHKAHPEMIEECFPEAVELLKAGASGGGSSAKDESTTVTEIGEDKEAEEEESNDNSGDDRVDEIPSEELGRAKGSRKRMTKREMKKQRQRQKSLKGAQQAAAKQRGKKKGVSFAESVESDEDNSDDSDNSEEDSQDARENGFTGEYTRDAWDDEDDSEEEKYPGSSLGTVPESSAVSESKTDSSSQSKPKKKKKGKSSKIGVKGKDPSIPKKIIEVSKAVRKGRKHVTLVTGLENFAAKPQKFQSIFRKRFATGVGFDKHETGSTDLVIQGEHCYDVITFLHTKYKVPANLLWYKLKNGRVERAIGTDGTVYPPP